MQLKQKILNSVSSVLQYKLPSVSVLYLLNFFIMQWFFVRLTSSRSQYKSKHGVRDSRTWCVLYFIFPLTGWWSEYKSIGKPKIKALFRVISELSKAK